MGLDPEDIKKHLEDANDPVFTRVTRDINDGTVLGVVSTPTFILVRKGMKPDSAGPSDIMDKLNSPEIRAVVDTHA